MHYMVKNSCYTSLLKAAQTSRTKNLSLNSLLRANEADANWIVEKDYGGLISEFNRKSLPCK